MSALAMTAALSCACWCGLLLFNGMFWRTDVRLPPVRDPERWPSVTVVVPARDEAEVLPHSLPSLLAQDYPGPARIVLVDDGSSDGTGALARVLAARRGSLPLRVTDAGEPPPGWTGKLWAVSRGMLPENAGEPEWFLLTDADIAHEPDSLRRLVGSAGHGGYALVSQMARLRARSGWEKLLVPSFVYFFAQLYPFRRVNRRSSQVAAAAGGCVLLSREAAVSAGFPECVRGAVIDDVALGAAVKRTGAAVWLGLADGVESVRPYEGPGPLWRMVSRSAYAQLRHSPLLLAGTVLALVLVYLLPPVVLVAGSLAGDPAAAVGAGAAWLMMSGSYLPMLRYYGRTPAWAPLLPVIAMLYLLMTVDSAVQHRRGKGAAWKGRTYGRPERVEGGSA